MGMDVIGKNPTDVEGDYFRNNVWWWLPLWEYCDRIAPEICVRVHYPNTNNGDGLDEKDSAELSKRLYTSLNDGTADQYITERNEYLDLLPQRKCFHCRSTGMRQWYVNTDDNSRRSIWTYDYIALLAGNGQELPEYTRLEKLEGEKLEEKMCNACKGSGKIEPYEKDYFLNTKNIRAFARFLKSCGGFAIW